MDGVVYSDRTPQVDYWVVRKAYSPVQVKEREVAASQNADSIPLHVENRHDFRSLSGFTLRWSLKRNGVSVQDGSVALSTKAKQTETVAIPARLPAGAGTDIFTLELRCVDETGRQLYERSLQVNTGATRDSRWSALLAALRDAAPVLEESAASVVVRHSAYRLELDRASGRLALLRPDGSSLVTAFGPHTGRNPTINDMGKGRERLPSLWTGSLLRDPADVKTAVRRTDAGIEISVSGRYVRPDKPDESVSGGYTLLAKANGTIEVSYAYAPEHATGDLLEAGLALSVPAQQSEFQWLGQGPYAGYPGKDRQNEYGLYHLNRDDLYLPGNRRAVELAAFAQPSGPGVLLSGERMTLDLENKDGATILSHLALVPGERSTNEGQGENVDISSRLKASSIKSISGRFILMPLSNEWPSHLAAWFGAPGTRVPVTRPFTRSYDQ